jgi:hypothetical protein
MDRERFDAIAKLFADTRSRRRALGLLLGAGLLAPHSTLLAGPGKGVGHSKCRGQGHLKANGQGHHDEECGTDKGCPPDPRTGKPGFRCDDGFCSCGGKCCADQCFYDFPGTTSPVKEFCCTGPKQVFCRSSTPGQDPACCPKPAGPGEPDTNYCTCVGQSGLPTRYRRPG